MIVVAVDPFAQQLIGYYSCNVVATNGTVAFIPRAGYYDEVGHNGQFPNRLTTGQLSAMMSGLLDSETAPVRFNCPTGNCTYNDEYATIALCSRCTDASHDLTFTPSGMALNTTSPSGFHAIVSAGVNTNDSTKNIFLNVGRLSQYPGQTEISINYNSEVILGKTPNGSEWVVDPYGQQWYAQLFSDRGSDDRLSWTACTEAWQKQTWGCRGYGAARCSMYPCVQTLKASVSFGNFTEEVEQTYADWYDGYVGDVWGSRSGGSNWVMVDLSCLNASATDALRERGLNVTAQRFVPYDVGINVTDGSFMGLPLSPSQNTSSLPPLREKDLSKVPPKCIYQVGGNLPDALFLTLDKFVSEQLLFDDANWGLAGSAQAFRIFNGSYMNADTLGQIWAGMAKAFTNRIREWNSTLLYNAPAPGGVYVTKTCIRVRWPWIAFPMAVSVLTICFLFLMCIQAKLKGTSDLLCGWKSSLLPLIYHGMKGSFDEADRVRFQPGGITSTEEVAKNDMRCIMPHISFREKG